MKNVDLEKDKPVKHPFVVPEGYFEELNDAILNSTATPERSSSRSWLEVYLLRWPAAVALASLVLVAGFFIFETGNGQQEDWLAGISDDEIISYLATYELTEQELISVLEASDIDQLWLEEEALEDLEIPEDDIEDLYLQYQTTEELLEI